MKNTWVKEALEWVLCFVIAYAIYLVINYFIGTIAGVRQSSMYPTAKEGERVVISRRILFNRSISRGDIVIIEAPQDRISTGTEENINVIANYPEYTGLKWFTYRVMGIGKRSYIKRVIGLPGEHLFISEEGTVYINGKEIEEKYLAEGVNTPRTGNFWDIQIPQGYVFVMGDNRLGSKDSRELGIIPLNRVEGKVCIRIWPFTKIGKI